MPVTYRTERWDAGWGGWRHDGGEVSGRHLAAALDIARRSTRNSSVRRRVVREGAMEVVATYSRGRRRPPA